MDLKFDRDMLFEGLQRIVGASERRSTMAVLNNVRLRQVEDGIRMDTTDLELGWKLNLPGDVANGLDIAVPARRFLEIVRVAPGGSVIQGQLNAGRVTVSFGRSRFVLNFIPGREFPEWDEKPVGQWLSVSQQGLRRLVDSTQFAMSVQDIRYYLQGMHLTWEGGLFRAVTSDGHRLALNELVLDVNQSAKDRDECITPRKAILELRRNLSDDPSALVNVGFADGQIFFDFGQATFMSKTIESRYPSHERVLPKGELQHLIVDREVFRQCLARVAVVTNDKFKTVMLRIARDGCRLNVHNAEQEQAEEEFDAQFDGEGVEICFNLAYLVDAVNALEGEFVALDFLDSDSTTILRAEPADRARYVVMPSRL